MAIGLFLGIKFKFQGNIAGGFVEGSKDELSNTFTDSEIFKAFDDRNLIERCYPPSNHFSQEGYEKMIQAVKKNDYVGARNALTAFALETAAPWCVDVFKKVATQVCTQCPKLLSESLPMSYF